MEQRSAGMNLAQMVFTLFYAIAWGTAANVQPRWKAFSYPSVRGQEWPRALCRISLSWILLNIGPVCFFVWVLGELNGSVWWKIKLYPWSAVVYWRIVAAIVPALASFGLYKVWMGIVQVFHGRFFTDHEIKELQYKEPAVFEGGTVNIIVGVAYIAAAGIVPVIAGR
jgi:hypothetical protein